MLHGVLKDKPKTVGMYKKKSTGEVFTAYIEDCKEIPADEMKDYIKIGEVREAFIGNLQEELDKSQLCNNLQKYIKGIRDSSNPIIKFKQEKIYITETIFQTVKRKLKEKFPKFKTPKFISNYQYKKKLREETEEFWDNLVNNSNNKTNKL